MSNWSEGYVNDINYTYGYYSELNPNNLVMPFLMAGLEPPQVANACELGFGQGVSVNIHAAAGPARWFATDFNPAQAAFAESLSRTAGTDDGKINLSEQGFSEFCARDDLPQFDYIGLHGIWSWISDDNRRIITDFLRRKLKVGGVLYISYNTLPGWSAHAPIRHLLLEHEKNLASGGQSRHQNIAQSLEFGENVFKYSPKLTETAPFIQQRFQSLKDYDSNYIAHEYLNQDWHPMYFSQIAQWLSDAKLSYACSTHYLEDFADCLFDSEQQAFFNGISRPDFAQTVKDYMLNRQFRRDYWVKGPLPLNAVRLKESRDKLRVMLLTDPEHFSPTLTYIHSTDLREDLYRPVLDYLKDRKIHSVADIERGLAGKMDTSPLFAVLALMAAKGDIVLCQSEEEIKRRRACCRRFNLDVLNQGAQGRVNYLASPVSGGGFGTNNIEKLFMLAHHQKTDSGKWAQFAWENLQKAGLKVLKDGVTLESDADNLAEIERQAEEFKARRLPMFQQLQCLDA